MIKAALSFGLVNGRPVFMDDDRDSYFLLGCDIEAEFLAAIDPRQLSSAPPSPRLEEALGGAFEDGIVHARAPTPRRTILDQADWPEKPGLRGAAAVMWQLWRAKRLLAREPIGRILQNLAGEHPATSPADERQTVRRAMRFLGARRLVPRSSHCLVDSIALLRSLAPGGGLLIFGVKLDPFAAHCWVQLGDTLLNDDLDHIAPFTPVRVVQC